MAQKIKVGAVSYLNTRPLLYGFKQGKILQEVELIIDYPAKIASMLKSNQIDIGLIPVAAIPALETAEIISDFCIGCDGEVASVCLFSDVPLTEIETVLLDYQSKTSVELLKLLLQDYWNIAPRLKHANAHYEELITGTTAGLVIGDRALQQRLKSKYIYDLGLAWKLMTGLPFVFAVWVSNKKMPAEFVESFNKANAMGLNLLGNIASQQDYKLYDLYTYYTQNIGYQLDDKKIEGMQLFMNKIAVKQKPLEQK